MHEELQNKLMQSPQEEEYELEIAERLHTFAARLNRLASEQVAKRNQIEQRWLEDIRQYHGEYDVQEQALLSKQKGSEVFVNITRNKTNAIPIADNPNSRILEKDILRPMAPIEMIRKIFPT